MKSAVRAAHMVFFCHGVGYWAMCNLFVYGRTNGTATSCNTTVPRRFELSSSMPQLFHRIRFRRNALAHLGLGILDLFRDLFVSRIKACGFLPRFKRLSDAVKL